jgi:hypothetical protein
VNSPYTRLSDLAAAPLPADSPHRFPDGGAWRIEIPSVEGPEALAVVLEEADRLDVPIHRVSQGSGVMMLTDAEISEMLKLASTRGVEVCLFLGPRGTWDVGAGVRSSSGGGGPRVRGLEQVDYCVRDALRAAELGIRNLLVADEGVLWTLHLMRAEGELPVDIRFKLSVQVGPANPISFQVLAALGADSLNIQGDLSTGHIAQIRAGSSAAIDLYIEAPDDLGGFVRLYESNELIRVGAPLYLKFGLRNAPGMYPSGHHLRELAKSTGAERVRRARLALDIIEREGGPCHPMSPVGDPRLPVPPRFAQPSA